MLSFWLNFYRDARHQALVAMYMPHVNASSFMAWRPAGAMSAFNGVMC